MNGLEIGEKKMVNIISQDRKIDADLRGKVERKRLYICKLHCIADQVIRLKFKYNILTSYLL